jgi:translation initiation factor 2 subunit 3
MDQTDLNHSVINIGTLGHIDHGKTTLTRAISGVWTDRHSESIKRNMTIKLGYADAVIKQCDNCKTYTTKDICPNCENKTKPLMRISLVDAPGHETLMATAIAGSMVIDAVLFVISADEPCPMQQTKEHLMIISVLGIKNVIIAQNKIDIVGKEAAITHYNQIKKFIKGSIIENAPIIPIMANKEINVDLILEAIVKMEKPKRDLKSDPFMYVVRSFDVNRPGEEIKKFSGGVIGGAVIRGSMKIGDEIEIRPGIKIKQKDQYTPIITKIVSINNGSNSVDDASPGGLMGIETEIDPAFTKADGIVGNVAGHKGKLPDMTNLLKIKYYDLNRDDVQKRAMAENEPLILGIGTGTNVGSIKGIKRDTIEINLRHPSCFDKNTKVSVMRNMGDRWRLTGYGTVI